MQPMWVQTSYLENNDAVVAYSEGETCLPVFSVQGEGGTMADPRIEHTLLVERITSGDTQDKCDVCSSRRDVSQIICVMESPTGEADGLANVVYICARCCAYAIQVSTGFRAVRTLASWYLMRDKHPMYKGDRSLVDPTSGDPLD